MLFLDEMLALKNQLASVLSDYNALKVERYAKSLASEQFYNFLAF